MTDHTGLFTIGQLARRTGLSVRTIRFWSDLGVVPPAGRSTGGYRLYDAAAVARLDLVRTLRELGLDLATVEQVVTRQRTVADVAMAHVRALDAEIRTLQVRRAVLRSVADRESTTEEMRLMHELARLSAEQRQRIIDDFVDHAFDGLDADTGIAAAMRQLPPDLPADPTPEQVDAWLELAELVADDGFRQRVRQMAVAGAATPERAPIEESTSTAAAQQPPAYDPAGVTRHAGAAADAGIAPDSPRGREVLDRIVDPAMPAADRAKLADQIETFTDRRVERYWHLMGVLNGRPAFPPAVPAFEWLASALRATG